MARLNKKTTSYVMKIDKFLGLNEAPDGDIGLKIGEAAHMRNFKITNEGNLQRRDGQAKLFDTDAPVMGIWRGWLNDSEYMVAAWGGKLYSVWAENRNGQKVFAHRHDGYTTAWHKKEIGSVADRPINFFQFANKLYILSGLEYMSWDGENDVDIVVGYRPLIANAAPPAGGGTLQERINMLNGLRRMRFSADGTSTVYQLPESEVDIISRVYINGEMVDDSTYTVDLTNGKVTFASAPAVGVDNVEVWWRKGFGQRDVIAAMRYAEIFNGYQDNRVFLYGNGTNIAVYSDIDNDGLPTAEYFPELNEMKVDATATPITAMVRHFDRLLIFKPDCAYVAECTTVTVNNTSILGYNLAPISRDFGCSVYGGAVLVSNYARTISGRAVYEWRMSASTMRDERITKRVSQRIEQTLAGMGDNVIVFDDEQSQEYYVFGGGKAVVNNYEVDAWYLYTDMPCRCAAKADDGLFLGTDNGLVMFGGNLRSDFGNAVDGYWESGAMDFNIDWRQKYSSYIWVTMKPENGSRALVTAMSDRRSDYQSKIISADVAGFFNIDFNNFSFNTNYQPQIHRVRMKVKKFAYYKLVFATNTPASAATILSTDIQIRQAGTVK